MASQDLAAAYAAQLQTADLWRAKCEGQIVLLALRKGLDAFQPPFFAAHRTFPCPFTINVDLTTDVYMTPCCLVHSGGLFYDPCSCGPCNGGLFTAFTPACQIPFDPRGAVTESIPLGGWRVSPLEVFLQADFTVGNVARGSAWAVEEGFLNVTGRYCDAFANWWPDDTLPVGYHAATLCLGRTTATGSSTARSRWSGPPASSRWTISTT